MTVTPSQPADASCSRLPFHGDGTSCSHCADAGHHGAALRTHILHLLSLIEHPDALPPEEALRIAGELLRWCDAADPVPEGSAEQGGSIDAERAA